MKITSWMLENYKTKTKQKSANKSGNRRNRAYCLLVVLVGTNSTASQQREPPAERLPLEEPYAQIRQHQQPQHMLRMLQATGCNMQQDTVVPTPAKKVQGPGERRVSARAGPGRGEQGVTAGDRGRNSVSSRREPKNVKCCMCLGCCLLLLQRSVRLFGMCYY